MHFAFEVKIHLLSPPMHFGQLCGASTREEQQREASAAEDHRREVSAGGI
jgi:hypothetical protein